MNRYQATLPRAAISIAAVAMTALTLGLSVLPAKIGNDSVVAPVAVIARGNTPPGELAAAQGQPIAGTPIVVYGYRDHESGLRRVHMPHVTPPQKQRI